MLFPQRLGDGNNGLRQFKDMHMSQNTCSVEIPRTIFWRYPLTFAMLLSFTGCNQGVESLPLPATSRPIEDLTIPSAVHNTLPIEGFVKTVGPLAKEAAALQRPSIQFISHRIESSGSHSYRYIELLIVNPLEEPMNYFGYRMDSMADAVPSGQISPIYNPHEKEAETGEWKRKQLGWCGTGSGVMMIPPKHAARFTANVNNPGVPLKIGIARLWKGTNGKLQGEEILSDEIPASFDYTLRR
jgi:hypothetical protein